MKKNLLLLFTPVALLLVLFLSGYSFISDKPAPSTSSVVKVNYRQPAKPGKESKWVRMAETTKFSGETNVSVVIDNLITYALSLQGAPYKYAGITPTGFDCSGFVTHVYDTFNKDVPHSSALQAEEGLPVTKEKAAPGDLVIFTGTDEHVREPGHVGIVISEPGDTIKFVHSSSNGGVKISSVQGTRYDNRFLEVRRVL